MNSLTLYQAEEQLQALLDTEEMVPEEQRAEFAAELLAAGETALAKRDRTIQFLRHVQEQIAFAKAEEKRLAEWRKSLERGLERTEAYILAVVEQLPPPKRGPKRLEGRVGALVAAGSPPSVRIDDDAVLPADLCRVEVTIPQVTADQWAALFQEYPQAQVAVKPDKVAIKKAIEAKREVPGADLLVGKTHLEVR